MARPLLGAAGFLGALFVVPPLALSADARPEEIRDWVGALDRGSEERRREAERMLSGQPEAAFLDVARAALSESAERRVRARRILFCWKWPTPELVSRAAALAPEASAELLADGIRQEAPVEMEPLVAQVTPPEEHLERQAGIFAAIEALSKLPPDLVFPLLAANLDDGDAPSYYTIRAVARLGGARAVELLMPYAEEDSTAGWIASPALAHLGEEGPLARTLRRSTERIRRLKEAKRDDSIALYNHACLLVLSGRFEEAAEPLEASLSKGLEADAVWARVDPDFDAVREAAWFRDILARHGAYLTGENSKR